MNELSKTGMTIQECKDLLANHGMGSIAFAIDSIIEEAERLKRESHVFEVREAMLINRAVKAESALSEAVEALRNILGGCDCVNSTSDGECNVFAAARAVLDKLGVRK